MDVAISVDPSRPFRCAPFHLRSGAVVELVVPLGWSVTQRQTLRALVADAVLRSHHTVSFGVGLQHRPTRPLDLARWQTFAEVVHRELGEGIEAARDLCNRTGARADLPFGKVAYNDRKLADVAVALWRADAAIVDNVGLDAEGLDRFEARGREMAIEWNKSLVVMRSIGPGDASWRGVERVDVQE